MKSKMYFITSLYFLAVVIAIIIYLNVKIEVEILGSLLILFTTVFFSFRNYYLEYDKFFKDLFKEFNLRYDLMNDPLNMIGDETKLDAIHKKLLNDYFNLCSEEYLWEKRGRLPSVIWNSWNNGMINHLEKKPVRTFFNEEVKNKNSYYGWVEYVQKQLND